MKVFVPYFISFLIVFLVSYLPLLLSREFVYHAQRNSLPTMKKALLLSIFAYICNPNNSLFRGSSVYIIFVLFLAHSVSNISNIKHIWRTCTNMQFVIKKIYMFSILLNPHVQLEIIT